MPRLLGRLIPGAGANSWRAQRVFPEHLATARLLCLPAMMDDKSKEIPKVLPTVSHDKPGSESPTAEAPGMSPLAAAAARAAASAVFFQPLLVNDEDMRYPALEDRLSALRVSALGDQATVRAHLLTAVRLSLSAPFEDIREGFTAFVSFLHKETECQLKAAQAAQEVPSRFVDISQLVPVETEDVEKRELLQAVFLTFGRLSHMHRVLAWHPSYLKCVMDTDSAIMRDAAALPKTWRRYLAIMAAARHQCMPLIQAQAAAFVGEGGDARWLEGLAYAPAKFANLAEFNALIAHRPWLVTKEHIAGLVRGESSWSVTELVAALVVITTFHAQSVFMWGLGIEPEVDLRADTDVSAVTAAEAAAVAVVHSAAPSEVGGGTNNCGAGGAGAGSGPGSGAPSGTISGGGRGGAGALLTEEGGGRTKAGERKRTTVEYEEDVLKARLMADLEMLMGETEDAGEDVYEKAGTGTTVLPAAPLRWHPLTLSSCSTNISRGHDSTRCWSGTPVWAPAAVLRLCDCLQQCAKDTGTLWVGPAVQALD